MRGTCMLAAGALAFAVGCGKGSGDRDLQSGPPATIPVDPTEAPPPAPTDPAAPCNGALMIRLKGSGLPPGHTVNLRTNGVKVFQGGRELDKRFEETGELGFPVAGAYRIAVVSAPELNQLASLSITLGSGYVCEGPPARPRCSHFDDCGSPVTAMFDLAKVRRPNCQVVVDLDLGRTMQPIWFGVTPVAQYRLEY